ncbi:anti-sigma regulatory factor (Ser/Thr protein kinase) [Georgenia soli]|uniref:Anti-sigma regulatory factor (Ser/Thr protein kinase) n=1 Tax=Georgenia soli TaxID=638953 RepID=A0A2A9ERV6_9MICO|nr:ATP-binding protein [Georgenia soli]PFG41002.1 anti-sigma regulatory factor (Ser/Thr protein kinase) [Georgenia soli]
MNQPLPAESYPPQDYEVVAHWLLDRSEHLSTFRADLTQALRERGAAYSDGLSGVADRMVLVASELATNAIVHALPPTKVRLLVGDEEFVLDVIDHAPELPPAISEDRALGEGGAGLKIAQRVALDVAWYSEGGAKHVWARFPRR